MPQSQPEDRTGSFGSIFRPALGVSGSSGPSPEDPAGLADFNFNR